MIIFLNPDYGFTGPKERNRGRLQQYKAGSPFERTAMDVEGPFPANGSSDKENKENNPLTPAIGWNSRKIQPD